MPDAIPVLTQDIKEVKLTTGAAAWYNIDNAEGRSLTVDLPEHAVIYVYDSHDKVLFSTLIKESGNHIPLPKKGKIVFLGETGSAVRIN